MSPGSSDLTPALLPGTPCWIELATPDEAAARHFYAGLFGWRFQTSPDPATGRYTIASINVAAAGGMYQARAGQPQGWILHLAVHNTSTTAEWVEHLGGRRMLGPVDIPDRGSILHAVDPGGVPVVFWQPASSWEFSFGIPGTFTGADINTHDGAAADGFFCRLFNFTGEQIGMQNIDYAEWRLDQFPVLYRYVMGPEYEPTAPPHWMIYFEIDPTRGTDSVAAHAGTLGGTVVAPPFDTPFGRTAIIADPGGAPFSIIDRSKVVEGWGRAEVDDPYDD
ncbi:VOC family protein [Amycolatopsis cihanbeyliensis]|uniref:VOC domain-containing protein n=1 Tax=Amycolatopsis cihanbeyliensis TaxID=1128664 RepID=A0A542DGU9_AMYCI|nr:VOC family protein [Amycolatopsis cihanbeyliensis]TQJ02296.1 hypothetical protein FB471_2020 [Amycolatopsis cihanbeyliensis]